MSQPDIKAELVKIDQAIAAQEALRGVLPDEQVEAALAPLRQKRAELASQLPQTGGAAVDLSGSKIEGSVFTGTVSAGRDVTGRNKTVLTGNFQQAMLALGNAQQRIGTIPHAGEDAKADLSQLVQQLQEALAQTPPARQEEAEAVAVAARELVDKAQAEKPNKTSIRISGEGLKKAAENLADVMPTVLTIAGQIVKAVIRFIPG